MKRLTDYKEIIHKCSKCGLCQSVCPNYLETGNECTVSRGLFIMLKGVINGDLKLNRNIEKYLDACLKCGKCTDFCPSGINIVEVLLAAKHEFYKRSIKSKITSILHSKFFFNTFLKLISKKKKKREYKSDKKVIYFGGCIERVKPETGEFVRDILNRLGYEVIEIDFNCCGIPFLTAGNLERFEEQKRENLEKIKGLDFEYFVTDCASCQWVWKEYGEIEDSKFKSIYELIDENEIAFVSKHDRRITYHKPCHEKSDAPENIIKKVENCSYVELEGKDECCGLACLSSISRKNKMKNLVNAKCSIVLTTCVGCMINIELMFQEFLTKRVIDFLQKDCSIK